jgi:hypothetical protein
MRQKQQRTRPDVVTNPLDFSNPKKEMIYHALEPLDLVATECEQKWGSNRLQRLVDPDTAARFGSAKAKLDLAIMEDDVKGVVKRAAVMIRAWKALDAEATASGSVGVSRKVRIITAASGRSYAICKDEATAREVVRSKTAGDASVWSLQEVVRVLESDRHNLVSVTKDIFKDAEVGGIKKKEKKQALNDEIPF